MPSALALWSLNKKIRKANITIEIKVFFFFFLLAFGLFASNSPVESPINNELLPLFFAGDTERERGTKGSSCEDWADRTGEAVGTAGDCITLWNNGSGCSESLEQVSDVVHRSWIRI